MAPISGIYVFVGFDVPSVSIWGSFDPTRHQETLVQIQSIADRNADTFGGDANLPLADHDIGLLRFPDLSGALAAAAALQVDLSDANLPGRVAVTINEGLRESIASHVIDRLRSMVELAHPGQVVADGLSYSLSQSIEYPSESMTDLGMHYVGARSISERLYQLHHPRLASTFPSSTANTPPAFSLPGGLTAFIGRQEDIAAIQDRFMLSRLVTLVGTGGIGKTRVAIQVGHEMLPHQADGVWFVNLANVPAKLMVDRIANSLGFMKEPCRHEVAELERELSVRSLLLILDNAEELARPLAHWIEHISATCPNIQFLVTSRMPLRVAGESVYRLGTLGVPASADAPESLVHRDSVRLFLSRITLQYPDFEPSPEELKSVAKICRLVDGIPLAIEIASGQFPKLSLDRIGHALELSTLDVRSRLRSVAKRQESMEATIRWSFESLGPDQRDYFLKLGLFAGRFSPAMAAELTDVADPELLESLLHLSLVQEVQGRLRLLEPVREFAIRRLVTENDVPAWKDRFADVVLGIVRKLASWDSDHEAQIRSEVKQNLANIRSAIEWTLTGDKDSRAFEFLQNMFEYWYFEGMMEESVHYFDQWLRLDRSAPPSLERIRILNCAGTMLLQSGSYAKSSSYFHRAIRCAHAMGDPYRASIISCNLGLALRRQGKFQEAHNKIKSGLQTVRKLAPLDDRQLENCFQYCNNLCTTAMDLGRYEEAEAWLAEMKALPRPWTNHNEVCCSLQMGSLLLRREQWAQAQESFERVIVLAHRIGERREVLLAASLLIVAAEHQGLDRFAAAMCGFRAEMKTDRLVWLNPSTSAMINRSEEAARQRLGGHFALEYDRGRQITEEQLAHYLSDRIELADLS